jgi:coenzyme F420 hydrogenase subunit beta
LLVLDEKFLLGSYKKVFKVKSSEGKPIESLFKLMLQNGLLDGLLTCKETGQSSVPNLITKAEEVELPSLNRCFGVNALLKKAVQKYKLNKLALFAPACMFDGLNKTQYFGIGCNWTRTAVALKVGFLCTGALTENALLAETSHLTGKPQKVIRFYYEGDKLFYQLKDGREIPVKLEVHHKYTLSACKYCLNMASKGTDITCIPLKNPEEAFFIVRSERGWYTLAQIQKLNPEKLKFKGIKEEEIKGIVSLLKEKMLMNIGEIIERIELGLPVPKWSDNKLRKFYRLWNSIEDTNLEEEVF